MRRHLVALALLCAVGQRPGTVLGILDGDTVRAELVLAHSGADWHLYRGRVRLRDVKAPELTAPGGPEAAAWMAARLTVGEPICFAGGDKRDQYGRPLVVLYDADGNVDGALLASGLASLWSQ